MVLAGTSDSFPLLFLDKLCQDQEMFKSGMSSFVFKSQKSK